MDHTESSLMTIQGGELKALGDMRVGGWLVKFSDADSPDLTGDFFTKDTRFGNTKFSPILLEHSMDPDLGDIELGEVEHKTMDLGIWVEGKLQARGEYESFLDGQFGDKGSEKFLKAVYGLVEAGKMGWSSGVPAHRVRREPVNDEATGSVKAWKITKWPLGLDASLTVQPAEPTATAQAIKSILANEEAEGTTAQTEGKSGDVAEVDSVAPAQETANVETETIGEMEETKNTQETPDNGPLQDTLKSIEALLTKQNERLDAIENREEPKQEVKAITETKAAGIITKRGDSMKDAFAHWMKTGDRKAVAGLVTMNERGQEVVEIKASNATDMNTTTAADGGNTVTDDMHTEIIRRADEMSLATRAGVRRFRSSANVLDIPIDNEADSEFVATTEANTFDQDSPAIGQKVLTKVAYTKYADVSYQLLEASSADVMDFVMDRVAIGKAKTDNDLLISEVESNGTQFKIFAGTAAIAVDELEPIALNNTNAWYVQNPSDAKWIMAPATHQAIQLLDDANDRRYFGNQQGGPREILGSEVLYSNKVDAIGSGLKPVLFGNFNYVAQLEDPSLQFLRDPYTVAVSGQVRLLWYYRTAFGVLQAGAVGYGRNITT